ncbi:DUF3592 domain-containing protein [Streptomyces sp. NPDC059909]|uniref:DUF3592 domain-containing protein n=1 Tax=Streptomyces sp. NPDC059909 TaxID=3346998 RepID=UPI00365B9461
MSATHVGMWVCSAAGAVCLWAAVREGVVLSRLGRHGLRTEGVVIRHVLVDKVDRLRAPVIAFTDVTGRRIEFSPNVSGTGTSLSVGSLVPVVYPREHPEAARVFTRRHRALPILLTSFASVAFFGCAAVIALTR